MSVTVDFSDNPLLELADRFADEAATYVLGMALSELPRDAAHAAVRGTVVGTILKAIARVESLAKTDRLNAPLERSWRPGGIIECQWAYEDVSRCTMQAVGRLLDVEWRTIAESIEAQVSACRDSDYPELVRRMREFAKGIRGGRR